MTTRIGSAGQRPCVPGNIGGMIIDEARDAGDIETARRLFRAYADALPFSLDFQNFAAELAGLPAPYTPPAGCLLLAREEGAAIGVVGLKPLAAGIAAIKPPYVLPQARGARLGRRLAQAALAEAAAPGHPPGPPRTPPPSPAAA